MTDELIPANARRVGAYDAQGSPERAQQVQKPESMTEVPTTRRNPLRNAPNLLTVLRICLAPFLVAAILENRFQLSFTLFIAAGLTWDPLESTCRHASLSIL